MTDPEKLAVPRASYECHACGECIGWIGRFLQWTRFLDHHRGRCAAIRSKKDTGNG